MDIDFQTIAFDYQAPDRSDNGRTLHPVVVVGAGPVGLSTAIDLARQGIPTILLDDDNCLSQGSRAICFSKRTLEIFDRLGCAGPMLDKGVRWNIGKVFLQDQQVYQFDLLPESGHQMPAFINLQQYYVEGYLHAQAQQCDGLDMRWRSKVTGMVQQDDGVELTVTTPDGDYTLRAAYVVAADGGRSELRRLMGLESKGRVFKDRFLIADVKMTADFPTERWFWFDPPFHPGQSVLLHRQPDNVWRIDFQLGWDADPEAEKRPENVIPRVQALLGKDTGFSLEWVSVYTFCCLRMDHFRHGRVLFTGDAAHGVSPFGARGANGGVQDADNLAWKLRLVLQGQAPDALLDAYGDEREFAADENILNSTRATDFITPKSAVSRLFRDAVLSLSRDCGFARALVNSGRLSTPSTYADSVLNTPDSDRFDGAMVPGAPCADAPVTQDGAAGWLLRHLGDSFAVVHFTDGEVPSATLLEAQAIGLKVVMIVPRGSAACQLPGITVIEDSEASARSRYDARAGTTYLIRPDQHVCARWREFDGDKVGAALRRATCSNHEEVYA